MKPMLSLMLIVSLIVVFFVQSPDGAEAATVYAIGCVVEVIEFQNRDRTWNAGFRLSDNPKRYFWFGINKIGINQIPRIGRADYEQWHSVIASLHTAALTGSKVRVPYQEENLAGGSWGIQVRHNEPCQ